MRNFAFLAASAAALLPALASAAPNLLTNGGFDVYTGPTFSGYHLIAKTGTENSSVSGWTSNTRDNDVSIDIVDGVYGFESGPYAIDLAGTPGPGSISQTLTGLGAPKLYKVSFYARSTDGNGVLASFGGTNYAVAPTSGAYQLYSFDAYVTSSNATLTLATNDASNGNVFVDTASVTAVPGPASLASFGLMALGGLRRRAKRA